MVLMNKALKDHVKIPQQEVTKKRVDTFISSKESAQK